VLPPERDLLTHTQLTHTLRQPAFLQLSTVQYSCNFFDLDDLDFILVWLGRWIVALAVGLLRLRNRWHFMESRRDVRLGCTAVLASAGGDVPLHDPSCSQLGGRLVQGKEAALARSCHVLCGIIVYWWQYRQHLPVLCIIRIKIVLIVYSVFIDPGGVHAGPLRGLERERRSTVAGRIQRPDLYAC